MGKITLPTTSGEMFNLIIKEKIVQGHTVPYLESN